jgi:uncharacterized membrane protein
MDAMQGILRWIHIVAGIMWIGLLYFFNFVNSAFAPTMDGETKKKVVPELMPRALFWFRWGAAYTWITGVLLVLVVFYHGGITFDAPNTWSVGAFVMVAVTFLGVVVYDMLASSVLKPLNVAFWGGAVLSAIILLLFQHWAAFSARAVAIHLGALFGTCMAYNVWMRIWPAQRRIITATKNGEAPNADDVALAGLRSKHNTYMSVPLVFMMVNPHEVTWLPGGAIGLAVVVVIGWAATYALYNKAAQVKGF